jgi:hypothetical protein
MVNSFWVKKPYAPFSAPLGLVSLWVNSYVSKVSCLTFENTTRSPPIPNTLLKIMFAVVIPVLKAYLRRRHVDLNEKNNLAFGYLAKCFLRSSHEWYHRDSLLFVENFELYKKIKNPMGEYTSQIISHFIIFWKIRSLYREYD